MKTPIAIVTIILFLFASISIPGVEPVAAQDDIDEPGTKPNRVEIHYRFDATLDEGIHLELETRTNKITSLYPSGVAGRSLSIGRPGPANWATIDLEENSLLNNRRDFSVVFWIRTTAEPADRFVVLSKKPFLDNSLASQKTKGWVFYVSDGTWAWNIGSGGRRLTYERDNGQRMPINDGRWHQLAMTYDQSKSLIRLYIDGVNWVTYNLADKDGFDFSNDSPLMIGWTGSEKTKEPILPAIEQGANNLQALVDRFNALGIGKLKTSELINLVIGPDRLIESRLDNLPDDGSIPSTEKLETIKRLVSRLSKNPYTVHQVADFMQVAPLAKLYRLVDGQIEIDRKTADDFAARERLVRPEFDIDELKIAQSCLGPEEIRAGYSAHFQLSEAPLKTKRKGLTAATFNIHHGGKHETIEEDGWDSRELIAEIIKRENIDIVMMQETYSSGDFIAAELGYYFATTVDWDYLNQGANISVLSRFPINEISVPPNSSFMNVAAQISISKTQKILVMSNWYGMRNFQDVFDYHAGKFSQSENIPILFGGDFNAVPHTDGGDSRASRRLLAAGFRDAYRDSFPDIERHRGASHESGNRIDQLYYKGRGLIHSSTQVLSSWPTKFPSDHYLIISHFELNFETKCDDD